jgi:hypothetical protein
MFSLCMYLFNFLDFCVALRKIYPLRLFFFARIWIHFIFHQTSSKLYANFNSLNLMIFDGISNDIQIV